MSKNKILKGDCLEKMQSMESNIFTGVLTDPPYGISFMGKEWDHSVPGVPFWKEILRVCKSGSPMLVFGGTRTHHRLMCNIEDSGWIIKDCLMWLYGSGFPKSHNIANSIDKSNGCSNRGKAIPTASTYQASDKEEKNKLTSNKVETYKSRTSESKQWVKYGNGLKPAWEPIILAMKHNDKTYANNAIKHGVAGINIDDCRIETTDTYCDGHSNDRWPANIILDEEAGKLLDDQTNETFSRFFYCSKVSDRNSENSMLGDKHPTQKPLDLVQYLLKLITMPENTNILDPFAGSGTTGVACINANIDSTCIEIDPEHVATMKSRIEWAKIKNHQ